MPHWGFIGHRHTEMKRGKARKQSGRQIGQFGESGGGDDDGGNSEHPEIGFYM